MQDKFRKAKKKLLTLILSVTLSAQGCSFSGINSIGKDLKDEYTNGDEEYLNDANFVGEWYVKYFKDFEANSNMDVSLVSEEEVQSIIKNYDNDDLCCKEYDYNDKFFNTLIDKIEKNSKICLKNNGEYFSTFPDGNTTIYGDLSLEQGEVREQLLKIFSMLVKEATNDIDDDFHRMQTLKIISVYDDSLSYLGAYLEETNIIIINVAKIKEGAEYDCCDYATELYYVLLHEINHLRQARCACRTNFFSDDTDLCYSFPYVSTLVETTAESAIYNLEMTLEEDILRIPRYDYSYIYEREDESLLFLLALFNKNATLENYYNAIFDTNVNGTFDFFGCYTEDEKYNLCKLIYIIDGINERSNLFYDCCDKYDLSAEETSDEDILEIVGYGYRSEIFAKCLKNMVIYTNRDKDFGLKDNLVIYSIIRSKMVSDDDCSLLSEASTSREFINKYYFLKEILTLDRVYMEFLCDYYGVSLENIQQLIDNEIYEYWNELFLVANAYCDDSGQEVSNLLEKFPVLGAILCSSSGDLSVYEDFLYENEGTVEEINMKIDVKKLSKKYQ